MVATAAAFTLATLRAGVVQIPAIGAAGAYWPLAAAAPAGFAGLDSDIKGVLVDWPVAFRALQDYAAACVAGDVPQSEAGREGCSARKINKTISLAFLPPDLVKAAINGFLRYGLEVARLCDLPAEWLPSAPDVEATTFGPVFTQERSASGKRDSSAQRQTAQNCLQGQKRSPRRPKRSRKSPPIAGFLAVSGKSRGLKERVVDLRGLELRARHAVLSNRPTKNAPFVGFELRACCGTVRTTRVTVEGAGTH